MSIATQIGFRPWDGGRPQARGFNLQTRLSDGLGEGSLAQAVTVMAVASLLVPVLVAGVLSAALISMPMSGSLPPLRPAIDSRVTRVYDVSGASIASLQRFEISVPTARGDITPVLRQAVVAAEDQRFYSHQGVDSRGIVRAMWADIQGSGYRQGGSTITQQYVRLAYADDRRTLGRKVTEAVLARRVEAELGKDEILYLYLQRAYFGEGAYGVGGAAETYFHKPVNQLTLSEAALLAGLLPAPSRYNPRTNPAEAEVRRMGVLRKMASQALITPRQMAEASAQRVVLADDDGEHSGGPATVVYPPMAQSSPFPWFADYVRRYLVARYGEELVYQGGLRVETSLDPALQSKAEVSVANALKGTQAPLEMAMVALDPQTGLVRAMVGGRDFTQEQVNLALDGDCPDTSGDQAGDRPLCISGGGSGRQPGSAFKTLTLAKAFEEGFSANDMYKAPASFSFPGCRGPGCTVNNVEGGSYGSLNLRDATAYSVNTVFAQLVKDVGVKDTAELAHRLGLTTINPDGKLPNGESYGPGLTLGAVEVSPLGMAAAYAVFAARGLQLPVSPVVRVTTPDGEILEDNTARTGKRVLAADVADEVTDVLKGVVGYGSGKEAGIGRPDGTAGKTGTSEAFGDAWFVGYTPSLVTSVWMGFADSRKPLVNVKGLSQVYGGTIPAQTWRDFMVSALDGIPPQSFVAPPSLPSQPARPAPSTNQPSYVHSDPGVAEDPTAGLPIPSEFYPPLPPAVDLANAPPTGIAPGPVTPCILCFLATP